MRAGEEYAQDWGYDHSRPNLDSHANLDLDAGFYGVLDSTGVHPGFLDSADVHPDPDCDGTHAARVEFDGVWDWALLLLVLVSVVVVVHVDVDAGGGVD